MSALLSETATLLAAVTSWTHIFIDSYYFFNSQLADFNIGVFISI
ncbi:hypothetical protein J2S74_000928 [Evansella vedderi]|uniref:Uncharacterized protein n=1 Tax=Evansella vedderi TaxID=38282 RepID=A0ABT9ZS41_9BACI|nr:hypothetical protein [Evansella vedderi]